VLAAFSVVEDGIEAPWVHGPSDQAHAVTSQPPTCLLSPSTTVLCCGRHRSTASPFHRHPSDSRGGDCQSRSPLL